MHSRSSLTTLSVTTSHLSPSLPALPTTSRLLTPQVSLPPHSISPPGDMLSRSSPVAVRRSKRQSSHSATVNIRKMFDERSRGGAKLRIRGLVDPDKSAAATKKAKPSWPLQDSSRSSSMTGIDVRSAAKELLTDLNDIFPPDTPYPTENDQFLSDSVCFGTSVTSISVLFWRSLFFESIFRKFLQKKELTDRL